MATKMYNTHLTNILDNCKEYYILDTYVSLVHRAVELKEDKFIIQTYDHSKPHLVSLVRNSVNATYKTIMGCISKLIDLHIIEFDMALNGWIFTDMEYMVKKKDEVELDKRHLCTGYTNVHKFFFTTEFQKMRSMEKRMILYMAQLNDSKAGSYYKGSFTANLNKHNNGGTSWFNILKTKDKYYARKIINAMLEKYSHIIKAIDDASSFVSSMPKKLSAFIMKFKCTCLESNPDEETMIKSVYESHEDEYNMIMDKLRFFGITLTKKKIMHLIRAIGNLKEWFLKERVVQIIINKYIAIQKHKSRTDIKSLPAYAAAVVKTVIGEYNDFIKNKASRSFLKYERGINFEEYLDSISGELLNKEIETAVPIFEA